MENCTIYSHYLRFAEVVETLESYNGNDYTVTIVGSKDSWNQITIEDSRKEYVITLFARRRNVPNYILQEPVDQFEAGLVGMYNFFSSIPFKEPFKEKILAKIASLNMGIGVTAVPGLKDSKAMQALLEISRILDGVIFSNANSFFPIKNGNSALFTSNKEVILADAGYSEVNDLDVIIESKYYFTQNSNQN